jgi:hypothetical protein
MPTFTVERDADFPAVWRVMRDGLPVAGPMSHDDAEAWLDNYEDSEQEATQ